MEQPSSTTPEHGPERTGDELEDRLERLDDHIGDAKQRLEARREEADPLEKTAGDWEDTQDDSQGSDALDFDDPDAVEEDEDE